MKTIVMCVTAGVLLLVGILAISVAVQMPAHRESEVGRLFTDRTYSGLQIAWIAIGVLSAGAAVFLSWSVWQNRRRTIVHR